MEKTEEFEKGVFVCKDCNERLAVTNKNGKVVHGRCGLCHGKMVSLAKRKKKANKVGSSEKQKLYLDVAAYPEIFTGLEASAVVHIRTVEHQAIAYIVAGLKKDGYGEDDMEAS